MDMTLQPTIQTHSDSDSSGSDDVLDVYRLPATLDPELTHLRFCYFDEDEGIDNVLPLDGLLKVLVQVPNLQHLEFHLHQDVDPLPLGSPLQTVALNHLSEVFFYCYDNFTDVDRIFKHLVVPPTTKMNILMRTKDLPVIDLGNTTFTELAPTIISRYSDNAFRYTITQVQGDCLFSIDSELVDGNIFSVALSNTLTNTFLRTVNHLPTAFIAHPSLEHLHIIFDIELPLSALLDVVVNIPQLYSFDILLDPGADLTISRSVNQSSRANLRHIRELGIDFSPRQFSAVDHFLSSIDISVDTTLHVTVRIESRPPPSGSGVFEVPFLMKQWQQRVSWCHLTLTSHTCKLSGITQRFAGDSARIPIFNVSGGWPALESPAQTLHHFLVFLTSHPIARLWITIEEQTCPDMPWVWTHSSNYSWNELLASVPNLEELALHINIWSHPPASSAAFGNASELFSLLQYQEPNGLVKCPHLRRLWLVLTDRTISSADCLRHIRNIVRFRHSVGIPMRQIDLAMDKERKPQDSRDGEVHRLVREIVRYGVVFRISFETQRIGFETPDIEEYMVPV
ncbi:uncharacterized protein STEHIDRAFT_162629 [Stereum hirsutum FP-91666 SS1]|uniref:uncharacterized protein n=1 Tax=Stereum hirsutum (strain FP-91666) TaxID=721885 RepID=UPI0004449880|nr:uncharacterized protein STEHIDRAFT_162629 [Stereum hirsutum FP-91666 SS1]EIM80867.1 hypothetical protein STEHIDRAFT_162629 [Stereum hirsutum FP-91666 SS1]